MIVNILKADVEVVFDLPGLEGAEFIDSNAIDPQLLCSEEKSSGSGAIGPFGLSVLASEARTEQTAIFFKIFRAPNRYIGLMCSDQSRFLFHISQTVIRAFIDIQP